jgi:heme A synthase
MTTMPRGADLLALGFGTTVAMWASGYVLRFPGLGAPGWLLLAALLLILIAGGYATGRLSSRGGRGGLQAGLLAGALNLLVLGSLLSGERPGLVVPSAVWWVPGSLAVSAGLGWLGARLAGGHAKTRPYLEESGASAFAAVAAAATFLLLIAGGIVTGSQAGLAVTDWPNSFGYNMFLYPLARMTGGIYYEHVHRLLGSLVGLTTVVLTIHLLRTEPRRWVKGWAVGALVLVIVQGLLGGLRVTGHFTTSTDPAVTRPSLALAVVHGVVGQVFFGSMVALAAFTSRRWRQGDRALSHAGAKTDRQLSGIFLGLVMLQLVLGAILRHEDVALHLHITGAVLVLVAGVTLGLRLFGLYPAVRELSRLGRLLVAGLGVQLVLGFAALVARGLDGANGAPHPLDVLVTTVHQATGALLLAAAVLTVVWSRRLLATGPEVTA